MLSKSEIKYIQSLFQKKFRDTENCYLAEGPKIVDEALKTPGVTVKKVWALEQWIQIHAVLHPQTDITAVAAFELEKISQLKTPNEVVALIEKPPHNSAPDCRTSLVLALDGIQDPGNLGTIVRIADWFGVPGIVCSLDCADVYNSKVVQATMGSLFRIPVIYAGLSAWLQDQNEVPVYGAVLDGTPLGKSAPATSGVLVIGNESKGIRKEVTACITEKITIERIGGAESLNAAVATGILLSHLKL
ncbi:TrmH family RNA methyltransferase [Niabella beijingensis]|uniref:TrmH family RNA methyltransferase n=1 Tax=Niabella beijingensis TaxID=2872700 RepID=UPI001CBFDC2C|nr:RNA methyltransferase [Niabella beijingensis]MBZ4188625.1 RNA methyltransferase [Niabella beijingensis]